MQKLISKYGLAAHLALVAVAPLFLSTAAVLWLSALCAAWVVMEPSRIGSEHLYEARRRVARAISRDPVFWVLLFVVGASVLCALNVGVGMAYNAEEGAWGLAQPGLPLMPGSVDGAGFPLVGCTAAALVVATGCRHGLGRAARGAFCLAASALSGLGALVWAILSWEGVASARAALACPLATPAFEGGVYGIFLAFALVAIVAAFERRWLKVMPLTLLGVGGNALGLFMFSPPAVIVAYAAAALLVFLYAFVYLRLTVGRHAEFKLSVFVLMGLVLAALAAVGLLPGEMVASRTEPLLAGALVPEGFIGTRSVLSDVALRIWKESPWLGHGLGSFPLGLQFYATPAEWQDITPLQTAVPNGYWMLLAESGVIGAFLLAAPLVLLLTTYVHRLVCGVRIALPHPLAWAGLFVLVVAALETLVDASFLTPGAAVALAAVLSISATAFPKEMRSHG